MKGNIPYFAISAPFTREEVIAVEKHLYSFIPFPFRFIVQQNKQTNEFYWHVLPLN